MEVQKCDLQVNLICPSLGQHIQRSIYSGALTCDILSLTLADNFVPMYQENYL